MRTCEELGFPVTFNVKNFTGKPMEELRYVVAVNLHRRDLDEFQKAEIGLEMEKLAKKLAEERKKATHFTSETGREAIKKRFHGDGDGVWDGDGEGQSKNNNNITSEIQSVSADTNRIDDG
jgi:hypothetical protein